MDIIELTRQLGVALQKEDVYKNYIAARTANDEDKQLQDDIGKFNIIRMQLEQCHSANEGDENFNKEAIKERIGQLNLELKEIYGKIMASESMSNYNNAKNELDMLVNKINAIIALTIEGEDPLTCEISEGCTGSCSSCSGCH